MPIVPDSCGGGPTPIVNPLTCETDSITVCQGTDPWIISGSVEVVIPPITVELNCETDSVTICPGADPIVVSGTVSITEPVTVDAVNLDIRDLAFVTDKIDVSGSAVSITGTVTTDDLTFAADKVDTSGSVVALDATTLAALETITVNQGTSPWVISGTVVTTGLTDTQLRASPVPISGTISVSGTVTTDNLTFADDKVDASGSVLALDAPTLAALESVTVQNAGGGAAVNIQDGGNSITVDGAVAVSGTVTADTNFDYAEDSPHVSGNSGAFVLVVRNDAGTPLAADGDYIPITTDATGALRVTGSAPTINFEYPEDSPHVSGDIGAFVLAVRNDAGTPLGADGDYVPFTTDAFGALRVAASVAINYAYAEDSPHVSGDIGAFVLAVRNDTAADFTDADGDYSAFATDSAGRIGITDLGGSITIDGTVTANQGTSPWVTSLDAPTLAALESITVQNPGGVGAVNIQDGGNSITVDNATLAVVGGGVEATALRVTIATDSTGLLSVDDNGGSLTVDGTFWQATQPVSGPLTDIQLRATPVPVSGPLTDVQLRATAVPVSGPLTDGQLRATPVPVSGTVTANQGTSPWVTDDLTFATDTVDVSGSAVSITGTVTTDDLTFADDKVDASGSAVSITGTVTTDDLTFADDKVDASGSVVALDAPTLAALESITVQNGAGGAAVNIQDGGNSITVDNATISVVGGGVEATAQRVTIANDSTGVLSVDDNGGSLTVDGVFFQATQPVSGPLTDTQLRATAVPVSGPLTDTQLRATPVPISGTVTITDGSGPITVDGTVELGATTLAALESITVQNGVGAAAVNIQDGGNSITIDNAALSVVGGGVEAAALRVTIANDSTGLLSVDDNGGSLTVDGVFFQATQPVSGPLTDAQLRATPVPVSGTVTITDGSGPITVDGTVELGATTLAALETITVLQGTSPWVVSGALSIAGTYTPSDTQVNPTDALPVEGFTMVWNPANSTWERFGRGGIDDDGGGTRYPGLSIFGRPNLGLGETPVYAGVISLLADNSQAFHGLATASSSMYQDGTGPVLGKQSDGGADANSVKVVGATAPMVYNGATWDRQREATADNMPATGLPASALMAFDGTNWDRIRIGTTAGSILVNNPTAANLLVTATLDAATLSALESITVQNPGGGSAVNIQDGGNSITVDGPLTDAQLRATPVPISGTVTITDGSGPITVDGTVELGATTLAALESITVQNGVGAAAVNIQDGGNSITVDGTVSATQGTSPWVVGGAKTLTDAYANPTDSQDIAALLTGYNGTTWDRIRAVANNSDAIVVTTLGNLASNNYLYGYNGTTWDRLRSFGDNGDAEPVASLGNLQVKGRNYVFNGTTWDRVRSGTATGSLLVNNPTAANLLVTATIDAGSLAALESVTVQNPSGASAVNIQDGGNSITVDNAALSVVGGGVEATALRVTVASDSTGVLSVDDNGGSLTVDGTVAVSGTVTTAETWAIGTLANGVETAVSTVAVSVVALNAARKKLILQNTGVNAVRIGIAAVTATTGFRLSPGSSVIFEMPHCPTGQIFAIRESADSIVLAQEVT